MEHDPFKISDKEFQKFSDLVYKIAGINLHDGKKELLQARIGKIIRKRGLTGFSEYFDLVVNDDSGNELVALLDAVSTNLTFFFREEKHFEFLSGTVLPQMKNDISRGSLRKVRAWSAGCSTGEEPYSILITMLESFGIETLYDIKVLASDISTRVLQVAMAGEYVEEKMKNVSQALKTKYFSKRKDRGLVLYTAGKALADRLLFRRINLMEPFPFRTPLNFIFCRNVMIYFDRPTQERLVQKYYEALLPGGYLFIGHSESLNGVKHSFKYVAPSIYLRS